MICFPDGNAGKYRDYEIILFKLKSAKEEKSLRLGEALDRQEIDQNFPHTVGYFKTSSGESSAFKPDYLELREIRTVEEFWAFLNSLNL